MSLSLELVNVHKTFIKDDQLFTAVSHVNLSVAAGEFLTFLGPSGCGKTTTLRMVAGFESPTEGNILLDGKDITALPANERRMGFVFQNYALFPHMTIFENVAYGLRVRSVPKAEIVSRVAEALTMVGLNGSQAHYPNQLSGGEQQRVALARVLVLRPGILLMDEPLSNLDAKLRIHMRAEIRRIQQELKLTCLYVTHDQKEALTMSDRIMIMNHGHIEQVGSPMEIYADPASPFVADFIGQANLISGTLQSADGETGIFSAGACCLKARLGCQSRPAVGEKAVLVIRPENLHLTSSFSAADNALPVTVTNRLFEGDRIDYHLTLSAGKSSCALSALVPFLPGTELLNSGSSAYATFASEAGVIIKG